MEPPGRPEYLGAGEEWVPPAPVRDIASTNPSVAEPAGRAPAGRGIVRIEGTARSIDRRTEEGAESLNFRLDRYDRRTGDRVESIGVEMTGVAIPGRVGENEEVEVVGRFDGGTLVASEIYNVTTRATIRALGPTRAFRRRFGGRKGFTIGYFALFGVVAAIVIAVFVVIAVSLIHSATKKIDLPNVVGESAGRAQFDLAQAGVTLPHIRIQGNPLCLVVSQQPPGGSRLSTDRTVTLVAAPRGRGDPGGCR